MQRPERRVAANAQHIRNVPERKTDVNDTGWIAVLGPSAHELNNGCSSGLARILCSVGMTSAQYPLFDCTSTDGAP